VFESRVLRRIFGPKYNYNDQVKEDEIGGACSANGSEKECMWVYNIKIDLR
jgi:hypothetical protein